jgi:outer membrane protein, heavy metal efflux system
MTRARESNPLLATARAEIEAAEGESRLVDKSWYPDVTLTLGANDLADIGPRVTGTVGIKVPLQWGVREAQAREATAKRGAAQLRREAAALKIESELQSALASLGRAQRTEDLLRHGLSQQSDAAYQSALASYQQGRGDLTSILDAARRRQEIRLEVLRIETEAQTAFAAIERLVGGER